MTGMALATLVKQARDANGWTVRDVEQRAAQRGHSISNSAVNDYEHGEVVKTLVPQKLIALAVGLNLPPYRVALAALADKGIVVPFDARSPEDAIRHDATLTVEDRKQLLELLAEIRSRGE